MERGKNERVVLSVERNNWGLENQDGLMLAMGGASAQRCNGLRVSAQSC